MQSWHTFFWAARFVISWLENFKAIVWSDQKFFDSPDKKHAMACKVCKNWAFQRNLLSSAHKKNSKREWFAIWFLGAALYTQKSMQISTFVPLLLRIVFTSLAGEKEWSTVVCAKNETKSVSNSWYPFFQKKIKINYLHDHSFLPILLEFILNLEFSRETLQNFVICYVNKNSKFRFSISRFVLVYFIFSSIINTLVFYVDIDWDVH